MEPASARFREKTQRKKPRRNAALVEHFYRPRCRSYFGVVVVCGFAGAGRLAGAPAAGLVVLARGGAATPDCTL